MITSTKEEEPPSEIATFKAHPLEIDTDIYQID